MLRRRVVPGAYGIGKVEVVYKPKKTRRTPLRGLLMFGFFFLLLLFSYFWSYETIRYQYLLPALRWGVMVVDGVLLARSKLDSVQAACRSEKADIWRSELGFTEIRADGLDDVLFQQGYMHAVDRGYQMELLQRTVRGNLSAVLGSNTIGMDRFAKTLGFYRRARATWSSMDSHSQRLLQTYAAGVNAGLQVAAEAGALPVEFYVTHGLFQPVSLSAWLPEDSLAILGMLSYDWSSGWEDELLSQLAEAQVGRTHAFLLKALNSRQNHSAAQTPLAADGAEDEDEESEGGAVRSRGLQLPALDGSLFAVGKDKSQSGSSLLFQSIHSALPRHASWYPNTLVTPQMHVSGLSLPGLPFVLFGRNEHLAWGMLPSLEKDMEDVFVVDKSSNSDVPTTRRVEEISVFKQSGPLQVEVTDTVVGPEITSIVPIDVKSTALLANIAQVVLASTALQSPISLDTFRLLNMAKTPEDLKSVVMDGMAGVAMSVVFAAKDGSVGAVITGKPPRRPEGVDGTKPIPLLMRNRWVDEREDGKINEEEAQPPSIIVVSDSLPAVEKVLAVARSDRERRISAGVLAGLQLDTFSRSAVMFAKALVSLVPASLSDAHTVDTGKIWQALRGFDGYYDESSVAPSIIEATRARFFADLLHPTGSLGYYLSGNNITAFHRAIRRDARTQIALDELLQLEKEQEEERGYNSNVEVRTMLSTALIEAIAWLSKHFGSDVSQWTWGRAHQVLQLHAISPTTPLLDSVLAKGPFPVGGGLDTVFRSGYTTFDAYSIDSSDSLYCDNAWITSARFGVDMGREGFFSFDMLGTAIDRRGVRMASTLDASCKRAATFSIADYRVFRPIPQQRQHERRPFHPVRQAGGAEL